LSRWAAAVLTVVALGLVAWIGVTLLWGEPVTALHASHAQAALRRSLGQEAHTTPQAFRAHLEEGDAVGTIVVPRLGLRMVVVEGTAASDLERGPGHYRMTKLPGEGGTIAVAGHRTTYLQPFRHLDRLHAGDEITLDMPYGRFRYRVFARTIVDAHDWSILRRRAHETLVLTACHPLYSASHRIVVFARAQP
jgi:sortase A